MKNKSKTIEAVEFQKWLFQNNYFEVNAQGKHIQTALYGTIGEKMIKTTEELYCEFKREKDN